MFDSAVIGQFQRRLVELGCPLAQARRKARELADHHADLKQAALEEGLTEAEAEAQAAAQLGEPASLAERLAFIMRQSSWWGRHPIIGFCLLPLFAFIPLWIVCASIAVGLVWLLGHVFGPAYLVTIDTAHELALDPNEFVKYSRPLTAILTGVTSGMMAVLFCGLARRSVSGMKWCLIAGAVCSLSGTFAWADISPNSIGLAWVSTPNWNCATIPMVVAAAAFLRQRLAARRLPAFAAAGGLRKSGDPAQGALGEAGESFVNKFLITPTYWISTPLALALVVLAALVGLNFARGRAELLQGPARIAALRAHGWPEESAAMIARVKSRQVYGDLEHETMIDLRPYVNVSWPNPGLLPGEPTQSRLPETPEGIHAYAGVTFDVSGKIQLMGRALLKSDRIFPVTRRNIAIHQKCRQLHLLHGAAEVTALESAVARLVLHYADGSAREIEIVAGEHVLDCWGPLYTTPAMGELLAPRATGTELAWVGTEGRTAPLTGVRVYRSTFSNPQPDVEIATVDYVSTLTDAAPFLAGLTLEK